MHLLITKTTDENILSQCAALMYSSEPWLTLGRSYKNCLDAIHGDYKEVYVIMEHETLKAFAVLQLSGSFRGYIQSVCVAANARGQGIGTALLQFCEERIFKISPNVFMCVSSFNVTLPINGCGKI